MPFKISERRKITGQWKVDISLNKNSNDRVKNKYIGRVAKSTEYNNNTYTLIGPLFKSYSLSESNSYKVIALITIWMCASMHILLFNPKKLLSDLSMESFLN